MNFYALIHSARSALKAGFRETMSAQSAELKFEIGNNN
jgi:hypothetical protein